MVMAKTTRNPKGTFSFIKGDKPYPTLLTKEIFRDIETYTPEILVGELSVNTDDIVEGVVRRVSKMLYKPSLIESDNGRKTIKTYIQHLANLGQYQNGLNDRNNEVLDMYLTYRRGL